MYPALNADIADNATPVDDDDDDGNDAVLATTGASDFTRWCTLFT
jgi:hypothetical protein